MELSNGPKRRRYTPLAPSAFYPGRGTQAQFVTGTVEVVQGSSVQTVNIRDTANVNVVNTDPIPTEITNTPTIKITDSDGNDIITEEGALAVNIQNAPFCRLGDGVGQPLGSELGALRVALYAGDGTDIDVTAGAVHVTAPTAIKMADGSGNLLVSTAGSLNVDISNTPAVKVQDGAGNALTSTSGALDVEVPNPVKLADGSGNLIASTSGSMNVTVTTPVSVAGTLATDYSYYFNTTLPSAWTTPLAAVTFAATGSQIVGSYGGVSPDFPGAIMGAVGFTVTVESASALDVHTTGAGARTVKLTGLGPAYTVISEIINMNGSTPVSSVNTYLYVFNIQVASAGSLGSNAGVITVENTPDIILTLNGNTAMADAGVLFIPATAEYFLQSVNVFSHVTGTMSIHCTAVKSSATSISTFDLASPGPVVFITSLTSPMTSTTLPLNVVVPGPAFVYANADASSTGTVACSFTGYMQ